MMKCFKCENLMDLEDMKVEIDRDTREPYYYCPYCGSDDVIEVKECDECGAYYPEDQIHGFQRSVCIGCISKKRYDLDFCKAVGDEEHCCVYLNGFLLEMFDEKEIEEILMRELKDQQKLKPVDGISFLVGCLDSAADVIKAY